MIKNAKQHKSCLRVQYSKETGTSEVQTATLSMLRASSLLITSGATLAEQKVHWMRSFEDIWKRVGVGAEALEPIVLDAEWQLQMQVRVNPEKLFEALGFPAGDYVIRRSTPVDRLLVQPIPNRPLKNQHLRMLVLQLLYIQQEFSEVRFDIIEAADAEALGDKLSRDVSSSANYLETKPDTLLPKESVEQPVEPAPSPSPTQPPVPNLPPTESSTEHTEQPPTQYNHLQPTNPPVASAEPPATGTPASTNIDPTAWKGKKRLQSDYRSELLDKLGYEYGVTGYTPKEPMQWIDNEKYDALGFLVNEGDEIGVDE